MKIESELGLGR